MLRDRLTAYLAQYRKVILIASDFSRIEEALAIPDMDKDIKVLSVYGKCV